VAPLTKTNSKEYIEMKINKFTEVTVSSNPSANEVNQYYTDSALSGFVDVGRFTVCITPKQLAVLFASMCSKDQAIFFSEVAEESGDCMNTQLNLILGHEELTKRGRLLMERIGEFSQSS
jgi:hypothetical protein